MRLLSLFEEAWLAIRTNRSRTALTILGIVIGVGSVISVVGVGDGAKQVVGDLLGPVRVHLAHRRAQLHRHPREQGKAPLRGDHPGGHRDHQHAAPLPCAASRRRSRWTPR